MKRPKRGEIYRANLEPVKGSEIKGVSRPVLIIQNDVVTECIQSVVAIPFTKNIKRKKWPFTVFVKKNEDNRLEEDSVLLCHQIRVLDNSRLMKRMGELSEEKISEVERVLLFTLGVEI